MCCSRKITISTDGCLWRKARDVHDPAFGSDGVASAAIEY